MSSYEFSLCCDKAAELRKKKVPLQRAIQQAIAGRGWAYTQTMFKRVQEELSRRSAVARAAKKAKREEARAKELRKQR